MTSRISAGLQSDISNAFTTGVQTGVNRASQREQAIAAQEKARILGIAQVREAAIKAEADTLKTKVDSVEKHYQQAATYYDDQNTYLQTQLLNNGARYTPEQRDGISSQIESNLQAKSKIMSEGAKILGLPTFTPPGSNVSVASQYSPDYIAGQKAELDKKKYEAGEAGLKLTAGANVFAGPGNQLTTSLSESYAPERVAIQREGLAHNIANDPPAKAADIFGPIGTNDLSQLRAIQTELPGLVSEHRERYSQLTGGKSAWAKDDEGLPVDPDPVGFFRDEIVPRYSRLAGYWKSNLDPDEQGVAGEIGMTFDPNAYGNEGAALQTYALDPAKPGQGRKAAASLYNKLGFGTLTVR